MALGIFGRRKKQEAPGSVSDAPPDEQMPLGKLLEYTVNRLKKREALIFEGRTYTYQEVNEQANRVANGLLSLGIEPGDRVAMMLPNIPEFVYSFFGIQKLGAVAVPFNTMYRGREIIHILNDSEARAIITLTNSANLINEIKSDCPKLEHLIVTGQRTLVFFEPQGTANVQLVCSQDKLGDHDAAFKTLGELFVSVLAELGVQDVWYKHQGAVRVGGKKIATIIINEIENLYVVNAVCFLEDLTMDDFFKVIWVPPEVKDKVLEPMTSVRTETGRLPSLEEFRDAFARKLRERLEIETRPGHMGRDEKFGYEKNRAVAYKQ